MAVMNRSQWKLHVQRMREAERLVTVVEQELKQPMPIISAKVLIDSMAYRGAGKSKLPLWMSAYLHLSRWHNHPLTGFAWKVSDLSRNWEQGYLKLDERLT